MCVIVKNKCFYSFTIILKIITKKMKHTILEAFTKKNSLRNLTRFHDGLFDLELLEISTTVLSLKRIKKSSQKDASDLKIA